MLPCFNSSGMILQRDVGLFSLFGKVEGLGIYFMWFSWELLLAYRSDSVLLEGAHGQKQSWSILPGAR